MAVTWFIVVLQQWNNGEVVGEFCEEKRVHFLRGPVCELNHK